MTDLFLVEMAVKLVFAAIKASNPQYAKIISILEVPSTFFLKRFIGIGIEKGLIRIDLTLAAIEIAKERDEYKELIEKVYKKAIARVYTEEEKNAIRKQYLDAVREFGSVGLRDGKGPKY